MYEVARGIVRTRIALFLRDTLGLFHPDLEWNRGSVLDVACGRGEWVLDAAHAYRDTFFVGIDTDQNSIRYANACRHVQQRDNCDFFRTVDLCPLIDEPFDLVHSDHLSSHLSLPQLGTFLTKVNEVLVPGGQIVIREAGRLETSSRALTEWLTFLEQAKQALGHLTASQRAAFPERLSEAGYRQADHLVQTLALEPGSPVLQMIQAGYPEPLIIGGQLLVQQGMVTTEQIEALHHRLSIDLLSESFRGTWSFSTWVGMK